MTGVLILVALVLTGCALPVVVILSRATAGDVSEHDTPHTEGDCRHCVALTVLPVPADQPLRVFVPRQPGGGA